MGIDENGPYAGRPNGGKMFVDYDDATTSVGFYGSNVSVEPSVALSPRPWNIQYGGSPGSRTPSTSRQQTTCRRTFPRPTTTTSSTATPSASDL